VLGRTLGKGSITVTWRRDVDFSLPSPSVRQKVLGNEAVADVQFTETYLPKVTLGKEFIEYFIRALNKAVVSVACTARSTRKVKSLFCNGRCAIWFNNKSEPKKSKFHCWGGLLYACSRA
jgi:5,10-methenyltetrahydromethanopterin hydrogenase